MMEYALNETEVVTYRCCDGWQQNANETGCTQREWLLYWCFEHQRVHVTQYNNDVICYCSLWPVLPTPCCSLTNRKRH